jgi:hypothetical protein
MSVIEELIDRNALKLALLNRSEEDLEKLLQFVLWKIREPKHMNTLIYVFNLLVDYYMPIYGKNEKLDGLFNQVFHELGEELEFEKELQEIDSQIETVNNLQKYSY